MHISFMAILTLAGIEVRPNTFAMQAQISMQGNSTASAWVRLADLSPILYIDT
jgi:hypothetical protein